MTSRKKKSARDPLRYEGDLRRADGARGDAQGGGYWSLYQLDELYTPPRVRPHDGDDLRMAIGTMALNNGKFFAVDAGEVPAPGAFRGKQRGGTFTYSRQFDSRDAALRANAAWVLRLARIRFRYEPRERGLAAYGWKISEARYRQIVAWVYEVVGKAAPAVFVAPPAPPKPPEQPVDANGQIGMIL